MLRPLALVIVSVLTTSTLFAAEQHVMLEATADVGISSVHGRWLESNGGGPSSPIRQNQNWSGFETKALLLDFNTELVKGWTISEAYLHLYVARGDLYGVGLCEVLAPWTEGKTVKGKESVGAACWQFARLPKDPQKPEAGDLWAWPGSGIPSVSWAHPMARYSHAGPGRLIKTRAAAPDSPGADRTRPAWIHVRVPVEPALVASLVAGASYGFVLTDDKGQVAESYSLIGPGYPYRYNEAEDIYIFTREIQDPALRPQLEVIGEPAAKAAPAAPADLKVARIEPSTSTVTLEFTVPRGTLVAYDVAHLLRGGAADGKATPQPLPRWEIPLPAKTGSRQQLPIWTLSPGEYTIDVRAIDMAGNPGEVASISVTIPPVPQARLVQAESKSTPRIAAVAAAAGDAQVYVVPDVVKVDPVTGAILQAGDEYRLTEGYSQTNPVWNAADQRIALQSAANETVAFQVIVQRNQQSLKNIRLQVSDLTGPAGKIPASPNIQPFRLWYVKSLPKPKPMVGPNEIEDMTIRPVAWHADACVPMTEPFEPTVSVPARENGIDEQANQSIWVDIYVPKGTQAGDYTGQVTVEGDGLAQPAKMSLTLSVLPLALPDKSSWIVELNSYGGLADYAGVGGNDAKAREAEYGFYRIAKQHRQMVNALPYKQTGRVDATAPRLETEGTSVRVSDWTPFDEHFGPLLDGSAFAAEKGYVGPDAGAPISEMYTHFHENWPLPLDKWYEDYARMRTRLDFAEWAKTSRDLEQAFSPDYKRNYMGIARQFAEHCQEKGWTRTIYQIFPNNKYYFKVPYFATGVTTGSYGASFWLLDEPVDYDDYMAAGFFLGLVQQGARSAKAPDVQFAYRTDVSQPEMTRGLWDNICDLWVCAGGAIRSGYVTTAMVRQKWLTNEEMWHYGGGPSVSAAPVDTLQAFLNSWASGSTGMLPYWTTNGGNNWVKPSDPNLAIYYTGRNYANSGKDYAGPFAGLRIKIMRRAQQDIEYLHLLASQKGWDRNLVRKAIASYADDPAAPVLLFTQLTAEQQFGMREAVIATIRAAGTQARQ